MKMYKKITFLTILFATGIIIINLPSHQVFIMPNTQNYPTDSYSILTANVGNLNLNCRDVLNKLCYKDVEERIADNIKLLDPDIIALQEVLAPWQCKSKHQNSKKVCSDEQLIPQVRRLVGDNYTIICNSRNQFECIAVKTDIGEIVGCETGRICNTARTSPEIDGCDNGFTVSAATIKLYSGQTFDIVNFHPQSTNSNCRAKMISTAFAGTETTPALIQESKVILLGDFNLDPWRDKDESVTVWHRLFKAGWGNRDFTYHSGIAENDPPFFTSQLFYKKKSVDFVVSNFAEGICHVLGESPNTSRLDGGKGTDHRAVFGRLTINK